MNRRLCSASMIALSLASVLSCRQERAPVPEGAGLSGPFVYRNLAVYLVRGKTADSGKGLMTLDEAMSRGFVVVHETGDVNELEIENLSEREIYVQAGDIVKGGQQDRTFQDDLVLQPKSGRIPVASYCVENGRWSQRGGEDARVFGSSKNQLASKELKLAARMGKDQGAVWNKVAEAQERLSRSVGESVKSADSSSSLQLTLENGKVAALRKEYAREIEKAVGGMEGAVGFAMAINGKLVSADVYGDAAVFAKLWPRLLDAAATEAIAGAGSWKNGTAPGAGEVRAWMADLESAPAREEDVDGANAVRVRDTRTSVSFESFKKADDGSFVHKSLMAK
jgi:hypothetical protein